MIVSLLEQHGQRGPASFVRRRFSYDNSFLVADPTGAIVLETAGRRWAVERVERGVRGISNLLTIPGFAEEHRDRVRTAVAHGALRRACTEGAIERARRGPEAVLDLFGALRSHGDTPAPRYSPLTGAMRGPCMHAGGVLAASQTTASWVSDLRTTPDGPTAALGHRHRGAVHLGLPPGTGRRSRAPRPDTDRRGRPRRPVVATRGPAPRHPGRSARTRRSVRPRAGPTRVHLGRISAADSACVRRGRRAARAVARRRARRAGGGSSPPVAACCVVALGPFRAPPPGRQPRRDRAPAVSGDEPSSAVDATGVDADVVVVGAGLAGLSAARRLVDRGRTVVVLEARDRVGGRTEGGLTRDGVPLELGGQWIGATQNRMYDLVDELGLAVAPTWNRRPAPDGVRRQAAPAGGASWGGPAARSRSCWPTCSGGCVASRRWRGRSPSTGRGMRRTPTRSTGRASRRGSGRICGPRPVAATSAS